MRRATALMSLLAGLALVLWASAPAQADDPPGFNGTIKVHAGDTEEEPIRANEPHPGCTFHIHGFNFDGEADGTWRIVEWSPTGDKTTVSASGTWTADDNGDWRTDVMSLDSGHYKVSADQTSPAAPGGEKHKVFWVECGEQGGGEESPPPGEEEEESPPPEQEEEEEESPPPGGQEEGEEEVSGQEEEQEEEEQQAEESPIPTQAGLQQPPMGVSPAAETAPAQAPAVAGAQQPPAAQPQVSGLPSTSTAAASQLVSGLILMGLGAALMVRRRT